MRHGLTAQTVLKSTEDPIDYRAFERAIITDFSHTTTVERALVVRLASLLWRLNRATAMETESLGKVPSHEALAATRTASIHRTETVISAHAEPNSLALEAIISRISTSTVEPVMDRFTGGSKRSNAPKLPGDRAPNYTNIGNHLSFELVLRYQTSLSRQLSLVLLGITQVRQQINSTLLLRRKRRYSK